MTPRRATGGTGAGPASETAPAPGSTASLAGGHGADTPRRGAKPLRWRVPRVPVDFPVTVFLSRGVFRPDRATDLSENGLFVLTPFPLDRGQAVTVRLRPGLLLGRLDVKARVAWRRRGASPGLGLEFVFASQRERDRVAELVRRQTKRHPQPVEAEAAPPAAGPAAGPQPGSAPEAAPGPPPPVPTPPPFPDGVPARSGRLLAATRVCPRHGLAVEDPGAAGCEACRLERKRAAAAAVHVRLPSAASTTLVCLLTAGAAAWPWIDDAIHPLGVVRPAGIDGNEPDWDSGGLSGTRRNRPSFVVGGSLGPASVWAAWNTGRRIDGEELLRYSSSAADAVGSVVDRVEVQDAALVGLGNGLFAARVELRAWGSGPERSAPLPASVVGGRVNSERERYQGPRTELRALLPAGRRSLEMVMSTRGDATDAQREQFAEWVLSITGTRAWNPNPLLHGGAGFAMRAGLGALAGLVLATVLRAVKRLARPD